jgi:hypothetical protein
MTTEVACRGVCVGCRSQKVHTEKLGIGYPLDIGRDGARLAAQPKGLLVGLNPELGHFAHLFSTGAEHGGRNTAIQSGGPPRADVLRVGRELAPAQRTS